MSYTVNQKINFSMNNKFGNLTGGKVAGEFLELNKMLESYANIIIKYDKKFPNLKYCKTKISIG